MGKTGCDVNGDLIVSKFSEPIPWIGLYVAAASFACAIAMGADLLRGFRQRKLWFPSKWFSINATSLTIIAVAAKFSVDLNTPMPRRVDQLSKLSSSALICTVMSNSMPSLGGMENSDILTNIIALAIFVITVVVNICIQLGTGVIYLYWREHAVVMFIMLLLLLILSFSALTVPTTKKYFEMKCNKKYEMAFKECSSSNGTRKAPEKLLKHNLMKFWMMAHTCSPQFVMGRSVTCATAGALCLLTAMALAEALLHSYLMPQSLKICTGDSDYQWSTMLVLVTQTVAVGVGTVAPAIRWFNAVSFRCPTVGMKHCKNVFVVEKYWTKRLLEMKERPLTMRIHNRRCRKLAHDAKSQLFHLCIGIQTGIVMGSKLIQLISVLSVSRILLLREYCKKLKLCKRRNIQHDSGSESQSSTKVDLSRFVLHLEGEEELVDLMMKNNFDATDHWLRRGKRKQPKHLMQLLEKSTFSDGLKGVQEFDSHLVLSLDDDEPPNCWALPVATLTAIAVALPNVNTTLDKSLIRSIQEGFMYVALIDEKLDPKGELINIRHAASVVWSGVDLYHKWLDVDLYKLSIPTESIKEVLEGLSDAAKHRFTEFKQTNMYRLQKGSPSKWPIKVLAANSMYRLSQTMLKRHESSTNQMGETLFEAITVMISDIVAACLTNLKHVIIKSLSSRIEKREECVRDAVFLLGKTERILELFEQKELANLDSDQNPNIDEWRSLQNRKNPLPLVPSSEKSNIASSELYLTIE